MSELLRLGTMALQEAKTLQRVLAERGVALELDHNDHTCTRGCTVTVEMLINPQDLALVQDVLREQFQNLSQGLTVNWQQLNTVFDPTQSEATCPACGEIFTTKQATCPGCGLCF